MPAAQQLLDPQDILKRVLRMIGISDPEKAMKQPAQLQQEGQQPDPVVEAAKATLQAKQMDVVSKQQENQRKAAESAVEMQGKQRQTEQQIADNAADRQSNEQIAAMKEQTERMKLASEEQRAQRAAAQADAQANAMATGMQPAQPRSFGGNQL
jgi:hypothetical protein